MSVTLSEILREERSRRGWDQAELAKALGVGQQTVSRWERGSRPRRATLRKISTLLDVDHDDLVVAAGHGVGNAEASRPVRPLATSLPLGSLPPDTFERFCSDAIAAMRPGWSVSRFGSQGHAQAGIDIIAIGPNSGRTEVFQCKRHARFGPAAVAAAVDAVDMEADAKHLLLSRTASPDARREIAKHSGWQLLDVEDISRLVRFEIEDPHRFRLVELYFPGWAQDFLGLDSPGPWQSVDDFFAPFGPGNIYTHAIDLVGRSGEVEGLDRFLSGDKAIGLLVGRGGLGKTRLLKEIAVQAEAACRSWGFE